MKILFLFQFYIVFFVFLLLCLGFINHCTIWQAESRSIFRMHISSVNELI